mgnify:FL=1
MSTSDTLPKLPIKEFTAARGIKAAIWRHDTQRDGRTFPRYTVRVQKSYRDKSGTWRTTEYYDRDDLPHVAMVTSKAFEFISLRESNDEADQIPL